LGNTNIRSKAVNHRDIALDDIRLYNSNIITVPLKEYCINSKDTYDTMMIFKHLTRKSKYHYDIYIDACENPLSVLPNTVLYKLNKETHLAKKVKAKTLKIGDSLLSCNYNWEPVKCHDSGENIEGVVKAIKVKEECNNLYQFVDIDGFIINHPFYNIFNKDIPIIHASGVLIPIIKKTFKDNIEFKDMYERYEK
jgi:hypothetical protein